MTSETIKQRIDREVREAFEKMREQIQVPKDYKIRLCPMCNDGIMNETPTKGNFECTVCGALTIVARAKATVIVPGPENAGT